MQHDQQVFGIDDARRILQEAVAPWVLDLGLSITTLETAPPAGARDDWQPGAILRMPFSERLCRAGGVICGQSLMALADTAMVIAILAANRGFRPMTTVDQTTHFMKAASSSDVLADARGPARTHHELRPGDADDRDRRQAGRDGLKRLRDAVSRGMVW